MKLQTIVDIPTPKIRISHKSKLLFIGSCFTENIGSLLQDYKFATIINPCGIAYNPTAIANSISLALGTKKLMEKDFVFHNESWHSLHHHGKFSAKNKEEMLQMIEKNLSSAHKQLKEASHIFLTPGTAWVFEHIATRQIINNCHKLPANNFERRRLSIDEIISQLQKTITELREVNTSAEIIFTVSPVRHLKDGLHENQLSKASLLLAINSLQQQDDTLSYFPAYELAIDELRDYRFFAADFAHLNDLGIQYIWERFQENYICKDSMALFPTLRKLNKSLYHEVQNPNSEQHQIFLQKVNVQIKELEHKLPFIDFSEEKSKLATCTANKN